MVKNSKYKHFKGKKKLIEFATSTDIKLSEVKGQDVISLIHPFSLFHFTKVIHNPKNNHISLQSSTIQFLIKSLSMKNSEIESKLFGTKNLIFKFVKCESRSEAENIISEISKINDNRLLSNISFYKRDSEIELNLNFPLKMVYELLTNLVQAINQEISDIFVINDPKNNVDQNELKEYFPKLKDSEGINCKYIQLIQYLENLLISSSRKEKPYKINHISRHEWDELSSNFTYKIFKDSNKAKIYYEDYKSALNYNIPLLNSCFIPVYVDFNNKIRSAIRLSNVKGRIINLSIKENVDSFIDSVIQDNDFENARRIVRVFCVAYEKRLDSSQFIYTYPFKIGMPIQFIDVVCNQLRESKKEIFKYISDRIRIKFNF